MKTVIWVGPVSTANIASAVPASWEIKTYNRGANNGLGSTAFREWAQTLGADPLTALAPKADQIILAGFSAAHGATEVILEKVAVRQDKRLRGLLAVDSYYVNSANHTPKPGHLAWLRQIITARDGRKAWFTTSTFDGPGYLSARDSFAILADALDLRIGTGGLLPVAMPPPYLARYRDPVLWLDYQQEFKHVEHATKLAPTALKYWLTHFEERSNSRNDGFGGVALIGLLIAALAWSKSRSR